MKTTKLVEVFIKLFGLYFLILTLFKSLEYILYFRLNDSIEIETLFGVLLFIILSFLFYWLVIGYASGIVSRLKIKDDSYVNFGPASIKHVIEVAVIVLGLLFLLQNLPFFLNNTYLAFKINAMSKGGDGLTEFLSRFSLDYKQWLREGITVLIAIIFIMRAKKIASWICRSNQEKLIDEMDGLE